MDFSKIWKFILRTLYQKTGAIKSIVFCIWNLESKYFSLYTGKYLNYYLHKKKDDNNIIPDILGR